MKDDDRNQEVAYTPEALPWPLIVRVLAGAVAVSTLLCFVAYVLLRQRVGELHGALDDGKLGVPHEVADVEGELFRPATPPPPLWQTQRAALERYRFVDRQKRIVEIPVSRAIEIIARKSKP